MLLTASTLLFNGSTIHSTFGLGIDIDPDHLPHFEAQSFVFQRVQAAQLIIIDEISMTDKKVIDAVEHVCRTTALLT
uniref:ATP-dependent DNA helicase n=1 Tax=Ditylenchus dipsaci TaxID=166011 RepID=A0A915DWS3_9BILA